MPAKHRNRRLPGPGVKARRLHRTDEGQTVAARKMDAINDIVVFLWIRVRHNIQSGHIYISADRIDGRVYWAVIRIYWSKAAKHRQHRAHCEPVRRVA